MRNRVQHIPGDRSGRILDGPVRIRVYHRCIVGAVDGDGQCRRGFVAIAIADRIGVDLCRSFANVEALDRSRSIVQDKAVAAIGVEGQRAVRADNGDAERAAGDGSNRTKGRLTVGAERICTSHIAIGTNAGQDIARRHRRAVLSNLIGIGGRYRRIIVEIDTERTTGN